MKYEKRNIDSFLICSVLSYPHPLITWKTDNTSISESNMGEIESLDPFYVYSMINITGSNLSYECAIENSLLKQTWTGGWTMKGRLPWAFWVHVLCQRLGRNEEWFIRKEWNTRWKALILLRSLTRIPEVVWRQRRIFEVSERPGLAF